MDGSEPATMDRRKVDTKAAQADGLEWSTAILSANRGGETVSAFRNAIKGLKERTNWIRKRRFRTEFPFFIKTIQTVEGSFGSSVSCLFYYSRWIFFINTALGLIWFFFVVLPMIICHDYSPGLDSLSFMHLVNGQGPLQQLWFFYGNYSMMAGTYELWFVYIFCIFITVYFSAFMIILSMSLAFQEDGVSLFTEYTYTNMLFISWDHSVRHQKDSLAQSARIATGLKDMRSDKEITQQLNNMNLDAKRKLTRLRLGAWCISIILLVLSSAFVYWIGSLDMVESYQKIGYNVTPENFLVTYTPSFVFVTVDFGVSTALYTLPNMEKYVYSKDEFYASVIRVFLLKTSLLVLRLVGLRTLIQRSAFRGCGGTFIGQEMYRLILTKFAALGSGPGVYLFYWLVVYRRKKKKQFYMPPVVQELIQCQAIGWVGTMVFPLMPWLMVLYVACFIYTHYYQLLYLSRPMKNRWHQPSRSVFFLAMTLTFLVIIIVSFIAISTADTQFLFSSVVISNSSHVRRQAFGIITNDTSGDPRGLLYCGPISESALKSPTSLLVQRMESNHPITAGFLEFISSDAFHLSSIFLLCIVVYILVIRVRWEISRRQTVSAELNMERWMVKNTSTRGRQRSSTLQMGKTHSNLAGLGPNVL